MYLRVCADNIADQQYNVVILVILFLGYTYTNDVQCGFGPLSIEHSMGSHSCKHNFSFKDVGSVVAV